MNLNKAFLIGRITKDPILKMTTSNKSVVSFSLATNKTYIDKTGKKNETTEFHNVSAWGKLAETISKYCKKGDEIFISGSLQTRVYEPTQGDRRYFTEIIADTMQFGAKRAIKPTENGAKQGQIGVETPEANISLDDEIKPEDLPF